MKHHTTKKNKLYTTDELFRLIVKKLKEKQLYPDILDYDLADERHSEAVRTMEWEVYGIVHFGGSEGIYIGMYLDGNLGGGKKGCFHIGTFKTLGTSHEDWMAMSDLNGEFCYELCDFVNNNMDDFDWEGYKVRFYNQDGTGEYWYQQCETFERAQERIKETFTYREDKNYHHAIIFDNWTGKETVVLNG